MTDGINPALPGKRAQSAAMWAASDWADVATFIGPNASRFERIWAKSRDQAMQKGAGFAQGFCWPALFLGFAWFFYRKQWAAGVALLVLPMLAGYFISAHGIGLGVSAASAVIAKPVYVQHAVTRIAAIRARGGGADDIAAAGGISIAGALIGGAIALLALAAIVFALVNGVPADQLR